MEELIKKHEKMIHFIINKYYSNYEYIDDELYQCGCIGLWKAAVNYDKAKGFKFSTVAFKYIRNEIQNFTYWYTKDYKLNILNLDISVKGKDDEKSVNVRDVLTTKKDIYQICVEMIDLKKCLKELTKKQYELIIMSAMGYTQEEIAKIYKVDRSNISKTNKATIIKIRNMLE